MSSVYVFQIFCQKLTKLHKIMFAQLEEVGNFLLIFYQKLIMCFIATPRSLNNVAIRILKLSVTLFITSAGIRFISRHIFFFKAATV